MKRGFSVLSPDYHAGLKDYLEVYEQHYDQIQKELMQRVENLPNLHAVIKRIPPEQIEETNRKSRDLMRKDILDGQWEPLVNQQREHGASYASMGVTFREWTELVVHFQKVLLPHMISTHL